MEALRLLMFFLYLHQPSPPVTLSKTKCKAIRILACFLLFNSKLLMSFCVAVQPLVLLLNRQDVQGT